MPGTTGGGGFDMGRHVAKVVARVVKIKSNISLVVRKFQTLPVSVVMWRKADKIIPITQFARLIVQSVVINN